MPGSSQIGLAKLNSRRKDLWRRETFSNLWVLAMSYHCCSSSFSYVGFIPKSIWFARIPLVCGDWCRPNDRRLG